MADLGGGRGGGGVVSHPDPELRRGPSLKNVFFVASGLSLV